MALSISTLLIVPLLWMGCAATPSASSYEEELNALLDTLFQARMDDGQVPDVLLEEGVQLTKEFLNDYPDDSTRVPRFMYEKLKFHTELNDYGAALELIDTFRAQFPAHELAPKMLHFKGYYIYEQGLRDFEKARITYNQFLAEYPDHDELTEAVLFSLEHLGQSDDEILRSILKKAAERDAEQQDS